MAAPNQLSDSCWRYRQAAAARGQVLVATERFYRDVLVCQWRIDALESQLVTATALIEERSSGCGHSNDAQFSTQSRQEALKALLVELEGQQHAAIAGLEERASNYALSAGTHLSRFASGDAEREEAVERFRQLARETYADVMLEACGLTQVASGHDAICRFQASIVRRRDFWLCELEDLWAAWQSATNQMHNAGDDVVRAWLEVANVIDRCCKYRAWLHERPDVTDLAAVAANCIEVELFENLGLSGLAASANGVEDSHVPVSPANRSMSSCARVTDHFCPTARLKVIKRLLDLLHGQGYLGLVGEALLENRCDKKIEAGPHDLAPAKKDLQSAIASVAASVISETTERGCSVGLEEEAAGSVFRVDGSESHESMLSRWLAKCLISTVCKAARQGATQRGNLLASASRRFGGAALKETLESAMRLAVIDEYIPTITEETNDEDSECYACCDENEQECLDFIDLRDYDKIRPSLPETGQTDTSTRESMQASLLVMISAKGPSYAQQAQQLLFGNSLMLPA